MAHSGHAHAQGAGTVNSVDAAAHTINVSHGSIPTIGRPAMTMDFAVAPSVDLQTVAQLPALGVFSRGQHVGD
jgi:Cu/Ag efflux protein CusF